MSLTEKLSQRWSGWIAFLSLVVAGVSLYVQLKSKTRELSCEVIASTELTAVSKVPGLTSQFTYRDRDVRHLWRLTIRVANTGSDTLIGEGQHSMLIGKGVRFAFPPGLSILDQEFATNGLPVTVEKLGEAGFSIQFSQWKPGESTLMSIFLTSTNAHLSPVLPFAPNRDLVAGELRIRDLTSGQLQTKPTLFERMPRILRSVALTVVFCLSGLCSLITIGVLIHEFYLSRVFNRWKSANWESFASSWQAIQP